MVISWRVLVILWLQSLWTDVNAQGEEDDGKLQVWELAVICAAAAVVLVIICTIIICCIRRCRKQKKRYAENLDMALRLEDSIDPSPANNGVLNGTLNGGPKMSHLDVNKTQGRSMFGTSNFRPAFAVNVQSIVSAAEGPHVGAVNPSYISHEEEITENTGENERDSQTRGTDTEGRTTGNESRGRTRAYVDNEDDFRSGREDIYEIYLQENQSQSQSDTNPTSETNLTTDNSNEESDSSLKDNVRSTTEGQEEVYSRDDHFLY